MVTFFMINTFLLSENKDNLMRDFFVEDNLEIIQGHTFDKQQVSNQTSNSESGKVERVFSAINVNLSSELVSKTGAIYQFNVKGNLILCV